MTPIDYQNATAETALYPEAGHGTDKAINYCVIGLGDEAGEVLGKWKKHLRGDGELDASFWDELGDVLWYIARLAEETGTTIPELMLRNINKLRDRKARGVIRGNGDNR